MAKRAKSDGVRLGRSVASRAITSDETLRGLMGKMSAYGGREVRNGYEIIRRMVEEDHTIVLAFSGAMASTGFIQAVVNPLIAVNIVDIVVTTGANIYHDIQRIVAPDIREVNPMGDDLALRRHGWTRIYDHAFREEDLLATDRVVQDTIRAMQKDVTRALTTPEFHQLFARTLRGMVKGNALREVAYVESLLGTAEQFEVPIFCGAPQDGSLLLNVAYMEAEGRCNVRFNLARDIQQFAAYHLLAKKERSKKLSIIIFGGGVPKNYALQPEPFLSQICGIPTDGYDCDVQVCDAHVQNGGLSSCPASEGHTWGKTSVECVERGSQYVFADATIVAPLYVAALLQELRGAKIVGRSVPWRGFLAPERTARALSIFGHGLALAEKRRAKGAKQRR